VKGGAKERPIVLVGPRGAGKTTVGRLLAKRLGVLFFDTDEILAVFAGAPAHVVLEERGEVAFRILETKALRAALRTRGVVATGGGVVLRRVNRDLLKRALVIHLHAPASILAARLRRSGLRRRPSLTGRRPDLEIPALLRLRNPLYRAVATLSHSTARALPRKTVSTLLAALRPHLSPPRRLPRNRSRPRRR